jgi:peroxiredoxin Q/BCP
MSYKIQVHDAIPTFKALDQEGNELLSEDLLGTPIVLYFYPRDDSPNCTKEACSFRDNMNRLQKEFDVSVIGVSPDSMESHQKFIEKHRLNYTLLSDENQELCNKFGVIQMKEKEGKSYMGVERTTFFIDRDGIVQWIERPVNVEGQVDRIIEAIKKYNQQSA